MKNKRKCVPIFGGIGIGLGLGLGFSTMMITLKKHIVKFHFEKLIIC
jgi:hypothetical protein